MPASNYLPEDKFEYNSFRFAPELFELKSQALEVLSTHDIVWMTDFSGIDVAHDLYGLEIVGISDEETTIKIKDLLHNYCIPWVTSHDRIYQEESGWVAEIYKYPHPELKSWLPSDEEPSEEN